MREIAKASGGRGQRAGRWLSNLCLASGLLLLGFAGVARLDSEVGSRSGIEAFREARAASSSAPSSDSAPAVAASRPDFTLWSPKRIAAWRTSLERDLGVPIAVLRIHRLALEVPVWTGIDELTLNQGLGRVPGTARVGQPGNLAIAGHRDGFFRVLKDVVTGDEVELETPDGEERYVVERISITEPGDISPLDDSTEPLLTLITCYPFYFVGDAPQRYVVRAVRRDATVTSTEARR